MITFDELRIVGEDEILKIKVSINTAVYTDGVVDSIALVNYKDMPATGVIPAGKSYIAYGQETHDDDSVVETEVNIDDCKTALNISTFEGALLYVIVNWHYTDDITVDNVEDRAVALDWETVYNAGMPYIAQLASYGLPACSQPSGFVDFAIIWYALQFAIAAVDYARIGELWDLLLRNYKHIAGPVPCSCN